MNDLIENSIKSRKEAIFNIYDVKDKELLKEIDNFFAKMSAFGNDCIDVMEFETKLANSSLNQEYIDLFSKISQRSNYILNHSETEAGEIKSTEDYVSDEIESNAQSLIRDATLPFRRNAREHAMGKLRSAPIIGDVLQAKQNIDLIGGIRRKKKYKEEQEALQKELNDQLKSQE